MISAPIFCHRFIGRQRELEFLAERQRDAASGRGSVALIGGQAGIGKTRFLAEVRRTAAAMAIGHCLEHAQSPLAPLADVLRELHTRVPEILEQTRPLRLALGRLLPELWDTSAAALGNDRHGQYAAIVETLRRYALREPLVVAVEDLHWGDQATFECLHYLAERIGSMQVLLLLTYRSDELHRQHPFTPVLGRLIRTPGAWRIELPALADDEMRAFVGYALEGRGILSPERAREIERLAEGNPLFLEELLKHAVECATSGSTSGELPLSIRAAVLERLQRLSDDDRSVLMRAAVLGRRFDADFLARLAERSQDALIPLLRRARDLQLIVEHGGVPPSYAFRHALIREALYAELLAAEARPLHELIARELEALAPTDERIFELAYHWWAARNAEKAAHYNAAAGDRAAARLAHADAALYYERALELTTYPEEKQAALWERLGSSLHLAGEPERASRAMERAFAYYRDSGDTEKMAELALELARFCWFLLDPQSEMAWLQRAIDALRPTPGHPLVFRALDRFAHRYELWGDAEKALEYLAQAQAFSGPRSPRALAGFHECLGVIYGLLGDRERGLAEARRAVEISNDCGSLEVPIVTRYALYDVALFFGEIELAVQASDDAARLAHAQFMPGWEAAALIWLASARLLSGDLQEARKFLEQAWVLWGTSEAWQGRILFPSVGVPLALRLEDHELLERFAHEEAIELAFRSGEPQFIGPAAAAFAELYAARGELERARALVHRAAFTVSALAWSPWFATAAALYGDHDDLVRVRSILEPWASPEASRVGQAYLAVVDAYLAQHAAHDAAKLTRAEEAARRFAELRFPYYEALALELAERPNDALSVYRRIGDVRDARRLEGELTPVNRQGRAKTELTKREREIARLVAAGKSNRAIADELVISERTVESHLASIFEKLNIGSRAELAARIVQNALRQI